jgi:hypothetical protein
MEIASSWGPRPMRRARETGHTILRMSPRSTTTRHCAALEPADTRCRSLHAACNTREQRETSPGANAAGCSPCGCCTALPMMPLCTRLQYQEGGRERMDTPQWYLAAVCPTPLSAGPAGQKCAALGEQRSRHHGLGLGAGLACCR